MRAIDRAVPPALALIGVLAVFLAGRGENPGAPGFPLDDAWIHLVYGRGLLENGYLAYNSGVPATGCTSPAWAVLLAVAHLLAGGVTDRIVSTVLVLGAGLHLATAFVAARLAGYLAGGRGAALGAGTVVAAAPPLAAASLAGMEVALTGLLLLLATDATVRRQAGRAGLWIAVAGLARPEAAVAGVILIGALVAGTPRERRGNALRRVLTPPIVAALALVAWNLWASGRPLPATFYAKSSLAGATFPRRIIVTFGRILPAVPPFAFGLGWLALLGLLPVGRPAGPRGPGRNGPAWIAGPLAVGLGFVLANLLVMDPADPAAFYHQRYLLPAVPALLVALAVGAARLGDRLPPGVARTLPLTGLAALAIVGAVMTTGAVSRHLHSDIRNINEVQRTLGERIGQQSGGTWRIAASDAGAVRYFSGCETIDVIGLNTPEMRDPDEAWLRDHPVDALVLMPAWFASPDADRLVLVDEATTTGYTATSDPRMARQIVLRARSGADAPAGSTVRARFGGFHEFRLDFRVPASGAAGGAD